MSFKVTIRSGNRAVYKDYGLMMMMMNCAVEMDLVRSMCTVCCVCVAGDMLNIITYQTQTLLLHDTH